MPKNPNTVQELSVLKREYESYTPDLKDVRSPLISGIGMLVAADSHYEAERMAKGWQMTPVVMKIMESYLNNQVEKMPLELFDLAPQIDKQLKALTEEIRNYSADISKRSMLAKQRNFFQILQDVCRFAGLANEDDKGETRSPFAL